MNLELLFPRLRGNTYQITSPATPDYNCVAWAAGDDSRWWEPDSLDAEAFQVRGFEVCNDAEYEAGVEKLAIFADEEGRPTHAARQLEDGSWTSKLGQLEDIKHQDINQMSGEAYGSPVLILQRRRVGSSPFSG